jgi:hypothetical protein
MSSDDCKKFIDSVCGTYSLKENDKWKRIKKYKDGESTLRDFQNTNGDILIISEDKNGQLSVHSVEKNIELPTELKATLTKEKLFLEMFKLGVDINRNNPKFLKTEGTDLTEESGVSEESLLKYLNKNDDSLIKKEVSKIKIKSSLKAGDELNYIHEIIATIDVHTYGGNGYAKPNFVADIEPEEIDVLYDKENVYGYYQENGGISYFLLECGGDWECAVMFYIYWSEKEQRLKSFFPKGDGNIYNVEAKSAYGSEMDALNLSYSDPEYRKLQDKYETMFEEIYQNQDKHYKKAREIGFKQFKEHLVKENA